MLPNKYKPEDLSQDFGKEIDSLVSAKTQARVTLALTTEKLLQMGAKILEGDEVTSLLDLDVERYEKWNFQEFSWMAIYKDGRVIKQFEDDGAQHHFGDIDQSQLVDFQWMSCFDGENDNDDKRVIVTLNFPNGRFFFRNAFVPQEVRTMAEQVYPELMQPKLIMKMVKRNSETVSRDGSVVEILKYNRYLIGWESTEQSPTKAKQLLCIEPNGFVHPWHGA